jgi:hypothetical protein
MTSRYFSGFSLENEKELFSDYLIENDFTVSGFSFGAINAFEYTLSTNKRIDTLQLFSPAFFQLQDKKFKRMQLMFFKKNEFEYCNNFLNNISYGSALDANSYFKKGTYEQLELLLNYIWEEEKLKEITTRGINIEVYLGSEDKIIDSLKVKNFFTKFATVYYIKEKGHIL